jgi:divalent metal cation (Fe/Co/Zn/Cd) transporter
VEVTDVRVRTSGSRMFADLSIAVPRTLPLDRVALIKERIISAITAEMPQTRVLIHTEPRALDTETVLDRVLLIAAKRRVPVHHVTVQILKDRLSVSLDVEVDARMSLASAHLIASRLETAIRDELGSDIEVETHIEPLEIAHLSGVDAHADVYAKIVNDLEAQAAQQNMLTHIHNVRVRQTDVGLVVNYHCLAAPTLTVAEVHAHVDQLERSLRRAHKSLFRLVGHAEPALQK